MGDFMGATKLGVVTENFW